MTLPSFRLWVLKQNYELYILIRFHLLIIIFHWYWFSNAINFQNVCSLHTTHFVLWSYFVKMCIIESSLQSKCKKAILSKEKRTCLFAKQRPGQQFFLSQNWDSRQIVFLCYFFQGSNFSLLDIEEESGYFVSPNGSVKQHNFILHFLLQNVQYTKTFF